MSGSSAPFIPVPSSFRRNTIACINICITTVLVKVDIEVLKTLKVSDLLYVEVGNDEIYATYGSKIVGNIVVINDEDILTRLAECIESGTTYYAEIIELNIEEEICKVKIQAQRL